MTSSIDTSINFIPICYQFCIFNVSPNWFIFNYLLRCIFSWFIIIPFNRPANFIIRYICSLLKEKNTKNVLTQLLNLNLHKQSYQPVIYQFYSDNVLYCWFQMYQSDSGLLRYLNGSTPSVSWIVLIVIIIFYFIKILKYAYFCNGNWKTRKKCNNRSYCIAVKLAQY